MSLFSGLILGTILGLLFGSTLSLFAFILMKKFDRLIKTDPILSQETIKYFPVNLMRGAEGVGGALIITANKLIFKAHSLNIQRQDQVILISEIESVRNALMLGFLPTAIKVKLKNGDEYKFIATFMRSEIRKEIAKLQNIYTT